MTTTETMIERLGKLGLQTDSVATDKIESATAALACFPMYMVANVHQWTSETQFHVPVIDFAGSEAIREAFAIGKQERKLPLDQSHRRVLSKHLMSQKPSDLIIFEYALETLRLHLQNVSEQIAEQFRTAIARMIVAVAGSSGEGLLGSGDKFSEAERSCIDKIAETLELRSSPGAIQALNEVG